MKDVYKLFLDALAANELNEFVLGSNEKYRLICQYEELPTDPDQVFDAFKNYFNETKDHNIWIKFIKEIISLADDKDFVVFSLYYLNICLFYNRSNNCYIIELESIIDAIINTLSKYEVFLKSNKKWSGVNFKNGQWDNAKRLIDNINEEFNLNLKISSSPKSGDYEP